MHYGMKVFNDTLFISKSRLGWTAVWRGQVLGRVKDSGLARLEAKALAFMAFHGCKKRKIVEVDIKGIRQFTEVE